MFDEGAVQAQIEIGDRPVDNGRRLGYTSLSFTMKNINGDPRSLHFPQPRANQAPAALSVT
ncbi:MAG: hypothetical protein KBD86_07910 [Candidatus Promineofilum sp.]|nr:hypothetical protein [Promineifilum sp.]